MIEKDYFNLVKTVLDSDILQQNRTGIKTKYIPAGILTCNLCEGFPMMTASKRGYKYVSAELECFIKGITDKREFQKRNCHIWDEWCQPKLVNYSHNEDDYIKMKNEPELGPIYGAQWRCFDGQLEDNKLVYGTGTDQLLNIIETAKSDPTSRRLVCISWNPNHSEYMALTPCVFSWQIQIDVNSNYIDLTYYQRSCDLMLGVPADLESYSMLLILLANELGYKPRYVNALMSNIHIYENHINGAKTLLTREIFNLPTIKLKKFNGILNFEYTDFEVENYKCGEKINFDIAI